MYICKTTGGIKSFDFAYSIKTTLEIATNTSLGVVMGSELSGKCYVETDGTLTLVGFDLLRNDLNTVSGRVSGKMDSFTVDAPMSLTDNHLSISLEGYQFKANLMGNTNPDNLLVKHNVGFYEDETLGIRLLTRYINFNDGSVSTEYIALPMASETQGGTITAVLYNQIATMYTYYQNIVNDNVIEDDWS
jgi:hypothetical protein